MLQSNPNTLNFTQEGLQSTGFKDMNVSSLPACLLKGAASNLLLMAAA